MKKLQQFKVSYVRNGEKVKEISLSQNVILEALSIYNGNKPKNGEYIEDIIKVIFKDGEQLENLKNGITYNEEKYIPLLTSPSMQKHEEKIGKKTYKMEYLFIKESKAEFRDILENILSLGKSKEWEGKNMSIVKDVTSRLGLATSGTHKINYTPKFIVLPDREYTYKQDNYVAFTNGLDKVEPITPETHSEAFKYTMFDGSGLMSPKMANTIQEQLELNYNVDFAIIRGYNGLAIKGLCLKFDFMQYIEDNYKGDIEGYFEKREDGYYVRDFWGDMQCINNLDLILTESQCKWAKNFSSMKEYLTARANFDNKYKTITNSLYITKTNKDPKKLKTHTTTDYQLLNNLVLNKTDLIELSKETVDYYKKIIDYDYDAVRLFLGDIATDIEVTENGEVENHSELSASSKIHSLIQLMDKKALSFKEVRRFIQNNITKKICQVAGGIFFLEGGYKIIAPCPITFCNVLLTGHRGDNGLAEKEFYIPTWASEKVTISRNPIACYQEIQKTILTDKLDKWCKDYTPEIIFFNQKDNTHMLMSGADEDGDGCKCFKNNILYNSVITPEKIFVNLTDGIENPKHIYTREKRWENEVLSSGNLIGKIANSTVIINSEAQASYYYYKKDLLARREAKENGEEFNLKKWTYRELFDKYGVAIVGSEEKWEMYNTKDYEDDEWESKREEFIEKRRIDFNKIFNKQVEDKYLIEEDTQKRHKKLIEKRFIENNIDSFRAIQLSMMAIDSPKTLRMPGKEDLDLLEDFSKAKKPYFLCMLKKDLRKKQTTNYRTCLDLHAKYIAKELLSVNLSEEHINKVELKDGSNVKKLAAKSNDSLVKKYIKPYIDGKEVEANEDLYNLIRLALDKQPGQNNHNMFNLDWIREKWCLEENEYTDQECYDLAKIYFIEQYQKLSKDLDLKTIVATLLKAKANSRFVLNVAWDDFERVLKELYKDTPYAYIEDPNGEIDWMFKKYSKIDTRFKDNNLIDKDRIAAEKRLGGLNKIGFKKTEEGFENSIETYTRLIFNEDGFKLGENKLGGFYEIPDLEDEQEVEVVEYKLNKKSVHIVYKLI
ncbi:RNA dependent RNA polymerase (plasmid) [Clostridium perfringens]